MHRLAGLLAVNLQQHAARLKKVDRGGRLLLVLFDAALHRVRCVVRAALGPFAQRQALFHLFVRYHQKDRPVRTLQPVRSLVKRLRLRQCPARALKHYPVVFREAEQRLYKQVG